MVGTIPKPKTHDERRKLITKSFAVFCHDLSFILSEWDLGFELAAWLESNLGSIPSLHHYFMTGGRLVACRTTTSSCPFGFRNFKTILI
jgi:hypothetical protein